MAEWLSDARGGAREAEARSGPWIERFARAGYAAKGVVYLLLGGIALKAAAGASQTTDSRGAMRSLVSGPLGLVILACLAAGLAGYALWRLYAALADPSAAV